MYCKQCGTQIEESAAFCPNCGESCNNGSAGMSKPSFGEKILRIINILAIAITIVVGLVNVVTGNALGGIIISIIALSLTIFVFSKKQMSKIKNKITNVTMRKICTISIYLILPIVMFIGIGVGGMFDDGNYAGSPEISAKSYAEATLKNSLKNPDSLQVHSSTIKTDFEDDDYYYYNIDIDYSAQNGFGGYNRDTKDFIVKVSKNNNVASRVTAEEYGNALEKYMAENYSN